MVKINYIFIGLKYIYSLLIIVKKLSLLSSLLLSLLLLLILLLLLLPLLSYRKKRMKNSREILYDPQQSRVYFIPQAEILPDDIKRIKMDIMCMKRGRRKIKEKATMKIVTRMIKNKERYLNEIQKNKKIEREYESDVKKIKKNNDSNGIVKSTSINTTTGEDYNKTTWIYLLSNSAVGF